MSEREEFEAWYRERYERMNQCAAPADLFRLDVEGGYDRPPVENAWASWQARAARPAPAQDPVRVPREALSEAIAELRQMATILRDCHTVNGIWAASEAGAKAEHDRLLALAAALAAAPCADEAGAPARLMHWTGPAHMRVPHGGICARTYAEFPKGAGENGGYWKEGEPLYTAPPAAAPKGDEAREAERWRALIGCARIRMFGWAGLNADGVPPAESDGYVHFGAEFWTHYPESVDTSTAAAVITAFADAAIAAGRREG